MQIKQHTFLSLLKIRPLQLLLGKLMTNCVLSPESYHN